MWESVQEERNRRGFLTREGRKHSGSFWLSGKVVCGKCGYSFIASGSTKQPVVLVRCRNRMLYGKEQRYAPNGELIGCDAHTLDERVVAKAMETIVTDLGGISDTLEQQLIDDIRKVQSLQTAFDPSPLKDEIAKYETKKQKAIDLMLDELITKNDLKKQTAFYDSEIVRLTEEIAKNSNIVAQQNAQLDEIRKTISQIKSLSDHETGDKEFYRSMIDKIIVPDYGSLEIHLNGLPMAFAVEYSVKKAPPLGIYDITVDKSEIMES